MKTQTQSTADPEELLTLKEVGALLKVSRMTLFRWIKAKKLPAVRLNASGSYWRVKRGDALSMLVSPV